MRIAHSAHRCLSVITAVVTISLASLAAAQQPTPAGNQGSPTAATPGGKPALSPADQKIKDAYDRTKNASSLDDFTQIITLCQDGLNQGVSGDSAGYARKLQAWAFNRRGEKYSDAGDEKKALKDFEAAVPLDPSLWKAVQNRGVSRAFLGDTKGAQADFDVVIRVNPNYANAWYNRAELKYNAGDVAGAIDDYDRAIQIQPGDAGFYKSRGHAQGRLGNFRESLADYNRAVQINPDDAEALISRGDAYRDQGMYGPAASDYRDAVHANSKFGRAYLSTAWLMATCPDPRYRDADKAIAAAQRAIELDGDKDYRYLDTLAAAQASAGKFDDAKATAAKALNETPNKEIAHVRQRLELYESSRAFRDGAPAEPVKPASANMRAS